MSEQVLAEAIEDGSFPNSGLPVAEILVLTGFLMIYLLEEVMHFTLVKYGNLGKAQAFIDIVTFKYLLQKMRRMRRTMVLAAVTATPMTTSSSQLRQDFRSDNQLVIVPRNFILQFSLPGGSTRVPCCVGSLNSRFV